MGDGEQLRRPPTVRELPTIRADLGRYARVSKRVSFPPPRGARRIGPSRAARVYLRGQPGGATGSGRNRVQYQITPLPGAPTPMSVSAGDLAGTAAGPHSRPFENPQPSDPKTLPNLCNLPPASSSATLVEKSPGPDLSPTGQVPNWVRSANRRATTRHLRDPQLGSFRQKRV